MQRRIDIDNSHKKQRSVDSQYQKQKAKTKRLVIDAEMPANILFSYFSLECTQSFAVLTIK